MKYMYLEKKNLGRFVESLIGPYKVVAPVKKENLFVFAQVENFEDIALEYIPTILPPKKYFFPQRQRLGSFKMDEVTMSQAAVEVSPTVIFGAHTCDIDGISCLDVVFHDSPPDPYFLKIKKSLLIIGYECLTPCDEYATCSAMDTHNPKGGYDIMLTNMPDRYIVHVNSERGIRLFKDNTLFENIEDRASMEASLLRIRKDKEKAFKSSLSAGYRELPKIFGSSYNSKVWDYVGKRCLSCGNCTAVCPTCYCFDIYDDVRLDLSGGERRRVWDSCQLDEFAVVAGGESFRKKRSSRQRHRYYRKFDYPIRKYNKFFCTGCGRCTRACMAKISLIETVNELTKEYRDAK